MFLYGMHSKERMPKGQMAKINGKNVEVCGATVESYLIASGYEIARVAVERNGSILPKAEYAATVIEQSDTLEIVGFVGGG